MPIPVAVRSKAYVCGRLNGGIAGSNAVECMYKYICLLCFLCVAWIAASATN